jgi:hypothetical protein
LKRSSSENRALTIERLSLQQFKQQAKSMIKRTISRLSSNLDELNCAVSFISYLRLLLCDIVIKTRNPFKRCFKSIALAESQLVERMEKINAIY